MVGLRRVLAGGIAAALMATTVIVMVVGVPAGASGPWVPSPGLRWQFQLQGKVRTNLCAPPWTGGSCVRPDVYELDLYANDGVTLNSAAVAAVHAEGAHAVCYVDAGTWESWRPDANAYPSSVLGLANGWPGERWLDIRATSVLLPIIEARVARCVEAGFDAVDFDNVDGYTNQTGFSLTASDQLTFDTDLADMAHNDGLSVALKNDLGQLGQLQGTFDFAVNEQCARYHECAAYAGWTAAHKAVVEIEYRMPPRKFCPVASAAGIDAVHKSLALRAKPWTPCR
jgi:hypothetical protein